MIFFLYQIGSQATPQLRKCQDQTLLI